MVTYKDSGFIYFYDRYIKLWTIYRHDENDNQINTASHYNDKKQLKEEIAERFKKTLEKQGHADLWDKIATEEDAEDLSKRFLKGDFNLIDLFEFSDPSLYITFRTFPSISYGI